MDKGRLVQDQFDSEWCPLVVVLLNVYANVKHSRTYVGRDAYIV